QADAIVVAIALTPETTHLLGEREFAACKPGALLVNVARGPVLDQPALVRALHSGRIGAAGVDVSDPEPLPADDPLWDAPNALFASAPARAQALIRQLTIVVAFPAGGATDQVARLLAEVLRGKYAETVIVDNRVGGNGRIGAVAVKNAPPDGSMMLFGPAFPM